MKKVTPIAVLTGYLGSGKTTLVNRLLADPQGLRIAVIVNDIGEINIDATLIAGSGHASFADDSLVALTNGCICCSLRTDLIDQIVRLAKAGC
nr:GTP-binding protein [Clostridia bacterium]